DSAHVQRVCRHPDPVGAPAAAPGEISVGADGSVAQAGRHRSTTAEVERDGAQRGTVVIPASFDPAGIQSQWPEWLRRSPGGLLESEMQSRQRERVDSDDGTTVLPG